jgi:hypothetical protein
MGLQHECQKGTVIEVNGVRIEVLRGSVERTGFIRKLGFDQRDLVYLVAAIKRGFAKASAEINCALVRIESMGIQSEQIWEHNERQL